MSGESFFVMIVRGFSIVTSVVERRRLLEQVPAVVEILAPVRLVARVGIEGRSAPAPALAVDAGAGRGGEAATDVVDALDRAPTDGGGAHLVARDLLGSCRHGRLATQLGEAPDYRTKREHASSWG